MIGPMTKNIANPPPQTGLIAPLAIGRDFFIGCNISREISNISLIIYDALEAKLNIMKPIKTNPICCKWGSVNSK